MFLGARGSAHGNAAELGRTHVCLPLHVHGAGMRLERLEKYSKLKICMLQSVLNKAGSET